MTKLTLLFLTLAFPLIATAQTTPFPKPFNSEPDTNSAPMAAAEAAAKMQLPADFKASVFAAEPDVRNPIAMTWDARGRLWVAENYTYAEQSKKFELGLRDRVLIFEDGKGDGHFSSRKVFTDDVQMLTSVEVGHGGVWLMCPPQLLFIPDRNGDDLPDGPAQVVLDGFAMADMYHNLANGLRFGPDGWLYGRCGGSCPGEIGLPGTPKEQRVPLRGGIWRYHPGRKVVEVLNSGTTNPWGHDWDAHGELFFINTVNGHLWHGITGSHLKRIASIPDPNPRAYELIEQHADHWHFDTTGEWSKSRDGSASALGGGHAHMGMMIYQGDNWPAEYRGGLFTENFHGRRLNREILERSGSGYVGRHGQDFLFSPDPWFRGLDLSTGPDGGVFLMDWSDTGECHDFTGVHRESGRIFKITHGEPRRVEPFDLAKFDERALVKLHTHANEWFVRHARLELAGRAANGLALNDAKTRLRAMFDQDADAVNKLRALWTLFVMGAADEKFLAAQLHHDNEHVRAWAVRLLSDAWPLDITLSQRPAGSAGFQAEAATLAAFVRLAREDSSALVRLVLASALQRLPAAQRIELAGALVAHAEDADDHNLPLLLWYGLIHIGDADPLALARLAEKCELPITRKFIARRLAEDIEKRPAPVNALLQLTAAKPEPFQADILAGLGEGLAGWRKATKPAAWDAFASQLAKVTSPAIRDRVRDLSALFGDGRALDEVKRVALDPSAAVEARKAALQTLIENSPPDLRQICEQSLD
ncbi:MAG: PVC-type heme-binding CxxCH protein, partial [Limisphaerales bacterium]